jgi:flagellar motor switch/type III secretory pathway protein FliN
MKRGIGLLTATQKSDLLEIAQKAATTWAQEWLGTNVAPVIHLREFTIQYQGLLQNTGLLCLDTNTNLGLVSDDQQQWARILFGSMANVIPVDTVFDYLCEAAQKDLLQKLVYAFGSNTPSSELSRLKVINTDGVLVILRVDFGSHSLELLVDSNVMGPSSQALLPVPQTNTRLKSVNDESIDLNIRFSLNRLGVADLVGLQVGDVIKSTHTISKPFDVVCNQQRIAGCSLGSSNGQLAVLVVSR